MKTFLAALLFPTVAFGASTGVLILQGVVGVINDIVITPSGNLTLNITAGEVNKTVASVAETSNNLSGYKIFISSPTGGELRNTTDSTKATPYQIRYAGATAVTPTIAGVQVKNVTTLAALTTVNSSVAVNVTAYPLAPAGTYQDSLTISIVAN